MSSTLSDLLSDLPSNRRRKYPELSEDTQRDIAGYIMEKGTVPPLRRLPTLFGPDCLADLEPRRHGWMAM